MLSILAHEPGQGIREVTSVEETRVALRDPHQLVWIDFDCRSADSDALLSSVFGFHPLAIEDVYKEGQHPKLEDYERYLYVVLQALARGDGHDLADVRTIEVDLFIGVDFVVTHHAGPLPAIDGVRAALKSGAKNPLARGPSFLAHAIVDAIVDRFAPLSEALEREVDAIEVRVLRSSEVAEAARILELMRTLHHLRRAAHRQREVLERFATAPLAMVSPAAQPFFRDVAEHFKDFTESLETMRDDLASIFRAFHSLSAHRMNGVIKVLTMMSTIMLPLTFVAGIYGMNFDNMPELKSQNGYYAVLGGMGCIAAGMIGYFRVRGWI